MSQKLAKKLTRYPVYFHHSQGEVIMYDELSVDPTSEGLKTRFFLDCLSIGAGRAIYIGGKLRKILKLRLLGAVKLQT